MPYVEQRPDRRTTEMLEALGHAVMAARATSGMSQVALAGRAEVAQSTISRFERGLAPGLRLETAARILAAARIECVAIGGATRPTG